MDLQNNRTRGSDQYLTTITKAYDMLVNYCNPTKQSNIDRHDTGVAFYNEEDAQEARNNNNSHAQSGGHGQGSEQGHGHGGCG